MTEVLVWGGHKTKFLVRKKNGSTSATMAMQVAFESTRPNTNSHPSQPAPHWSTRTLTNSDPDQHARLPRLVPAPGASVDVKLGLGLRAH